MWATGRADENAGVLHSRRRDAAVEHLDAEAGTDQLGVGSRILHKREGFLEHTKNLIPRRRSAVRARVVHYRAFSRHGHLHVPGF